MTLLDISIGWKTAIMFTAMMVVFYFFMIRPQSQQAKKEAAYRDSLKTGDRIMTAGGLHATIVSTDATQAVLEIAPGTRIKVAKTSIQPIPERKKK
ncbi:MAG: preprotein translocase subunit YajC [Bacteroidales bacterium]|nr:preprotein translocase subunit YajC [Bacteroidales bacterium]MBR3411192.1 preprotein translocase subunit YajC [Bacteroidales bacterium]